MLTSVSSSATMPHLRFDSKSATSLPGAKLTEAIWDGHLILVNPASNASEAKSVKQRMLQALERITASSVKAQKSEPMSRTHLGKLETRPHRPRIRPACATVLTGSDMRRVPTSPESRWLDRWVNEGGRWQEDEAAPAL